jgi:hypothetical protein
MFALLGARPACWAVERSDNEPDRAEVRLLAEASVFVSHYASRSILDPQLPCR